ncbi:MAG: hypothetical protein M1368_02475, partial [Thaumarchaeota archaeon]|nr:hypothetical protein [Nitrososphaerota archaeon]
MNDYVDTTQQIEEDVDRASFYRSLEDDLDSGKALTWTHLKGLMRFSLRSDKGKELGLWSLGEISEALGENWLSAAKTMDSGLDRFCYWAAYRNDIFLEIVEFALSLNVFKNVQGFAKIRRDIKNDASFDRFWHSRAVCQLGRQALMAGHRIAFEKKKTKFSSPIDLVIASKDGLELCCEVFCIFRSESMVNGFEHSDRISNIVERIASTERVLFDGHWKSMPDDATLECILEHIQELAATGSRTGEIHELHNVYLDARISPSNDRLGGLGNYSGPTIQGEGLERVLNKLLG